MLGPLFGINVGGKLYIKPVVIQADRLHDLLKRHAQWLVLVPL